eukprot:CAMPEP_0182882186 /NCGR_PEP_ID=MMETSP0034_2-20130328/17630_1 /TAXON_ID=156128 /ORGANISM="Nephroselmis pyriformis, Strain CCMP717" /LENGTH=54 /DNA_ID=CAMNT_0025015261 /DNA_START=108 /DNA_END=269 /DNA_ORIENTATION=+
MGKGVSDRGRRAPAGMRPWLLHPRCTAAALVSLLICLASPAEVSAGRQVPTSAG